MLRHGSAERRCTGADRDTPATSGEPHSPQNFMPGELAAPHVAHGTASGEPQSPQNFRPASFWNPHTGQVTHSSRIHVEALPRVAKQRSDGKSP